MSNSNKWAVAITTYNRPDVLEFTLSQFDKFGGDIIVIDDHSKGGCSARCIRNPKRLGIAKSKNKCISLLKDYDKIFLFDDDCFPIKDKWWTIYQGEHHYCHAAYPTQYIKQYVGRNAYWTGALGCAMMIDQMVLKECGGMDGRFGLYGYEHVEYTMRIYRMGLIAYPWLTPKNVQDYIWSMDALGAYDGFDWKAGSSIGVREKAKCIADNEILFKNGVDKLGFRAYD
jgi:glycosyltransferase involved in cell wall biosynthesis